MNRIVHICLTGPYILGMGYHENILPFYHKNMGFEVIILSYNETVGGEQHIIEKENGIPIERLKKGQRYGKLSQFGDVPELYNRLVDLNPKIIYVHNLNFISYFDLIKYKKKNPEVKIYVDNHNDLYNTPIKGLKSNVLYKVVFRNMAKISYKYVEVFWGVTPWRCLFLRDIYGVPSNKIKFLEMGGDSRYIDLKNKDSIRIKIRKELGVGDNDFLIVTGGKIDKEKGTHILAQSICDLKNSKIKLLIFGKIDNNIDIISDLHVDDNNIFFTGWKEPSVYYNYFLASDLAVFPGTHSILWEQACACGIPIVVKDWPLMHHIDLGGNAFFLKKCTSQGLREIVDYLFTNQEVYKYALEVSQKKCIKHFSYEYISKKSVGLDDFNSSNEE